MHDGYVKLLQNININNSYEDTYYFETKEDQKTYFEQHVIPGGTAEALQFTRKSDGYEMYVEIPFDIVSMCNYAMYVNTAIGKIYYCFVRSFAYENDGCTRLTLETDVIQTYLFDCDLLESMVEREHTVSDNVGDNTVPESIYFGDHYLNNIEKAGIGDDCVIVVYSSVNAEGGEIAGNIFARRYYGNFIYGFETAAQVNEFLNQLTEDAKANAILCMFMCPKAVYQSWTNSELPGAPIPVKFSVNQQTLGDYEPKNKKLLTYPYNAMKVWTNNGSERYYKYEHFYSLENGKAGFNAIGDVSPGSSVALMPLAYDGLAINSDQKFSLAGFPQCSYNIDTFKAYVADNFGRIISGAVNSAISIPAMGFDRTEKNVYDNIMGTLTNVSSEIGSAYDLSRKPPEHNGTDNAGTMFSNNYLDFYAAQSCVKPEYAKIIDDYFTMFGYRVMEVKTPSRKNRQRFTYVKTIGCAVSGNLPSYVINQICSIYDNGIRFWVDKENFRNFTLGNEVI